MSKAVWWFTNYHSSGLHGLLTPLLIALLAALGPVPSIEGGHHDRLPSVLHRCLHPSGVNTLQTGKVPVFGCLELGGYGISVCRRHR